jgi:hypothetical protein
MTMYSAFNQEIEQRTVVEEYSADEARVRMCTLHGSHGEYCQYVS